MKVRDDKPANRGVYCAADGLFVGPDCALIAAHDGRLARKIFSVRPLPEIDQLLNAAHGCCLGYDFLRPRLDEIAKALDDGNVSLAWIATLQLRLPNLLDDAAVKRIVAIDMMLKAGYNPDEPRDYHGRWTDEDSSGSPQPLQVSQALPIHSSANTLEIPQASPSTDGDSANVGFLPVVYPADNDSADTGGTDGAPESLENTQAQSSESADANWDLLHVRFKHPRHERQMSARLRAALAQIAEGFYKTFHRDLPVSSVFRTPLQQAQSMYDNLKAGKKGRYKDKEAYNEIKAIYAFMHDSGEQATVAAMAQAIIELASVGRYISAHLNGDAVDIQTQDLSSEEIQAVTDAAEKLGLIVQPEGDHLHLQFPQMRGDML